METLDDRDTWFDEAGEEATKAEEEAGLCKMAADTTPYEISAYVTTPSGKVIHKQRLVAMLNQCPTMSNDRLTRIAEGTRYGDPSETTTAKEDDGQNGAIELATRIFVLHVEPATKKRAEERSIWIGRVQKMGRKVGKKTYEYHDPVRINKVPEGGYMYSHWYGRVGQTNKWQYGVSDLRSFAMEDIKGVLKHPLTLVKNMSTKDKNMWKRDKAPPLRLSDEDYETWMALQTEATGNQRCFAT